MQEISFYCKKCKKSMRMSYRLSGNDDAPFLSGMTFKCHTNRCTRVVRLKNYTEKQIRTMADAMDRYYL